MICDYCKEEIAPGERADVRPANLHRECLIRGTVGSLSHQMRLCSCYIMGSEEGDPPGLTPRQGALIAYRYFVTHRYQISRDGSEITCLLCGRTSHNPNDVAQRYCGHCHIFHGEQRA